MKNDTNMAYTTLFNTVVMEIKENGHVFCDASWNDNLEIAHFSRMYYVLDGEGYIEMACGKQIKLLPNNLYFLPTGINFSYHCSNFMEKVYFHISIPHPVLPSVLDVFSDCKQIIVLPSLDVQEIAELYAKNDIISMFKLKNILYRDIIRIMEIAELEHTTFSAHSEMCFRAIDFIDQHLSIKLKIKDIANSLLVSESKLNKVFLNEMGIQLGRYIDRRLCAEIENALIYSSMNIDEISEQFQFSDKIYFARFFKRMTGFTPRIYRMGSKKGDHVTSSTQKDRLGLHIKSKY